MNKLGAIVLAAGRGSRMKSKASNKVTIVLGNKPMILHGIHLLQSAGVKTIVVVVGFAKESVKNIIKEEVIFAEQRKRLGTAHAVYKAMEVLPKEIENVLIIQGDDSAFYKEDVIRQLVKKHIDEDNSITFLTIKASNPAGLGRVVRNSKGDVLSVVEEKDATASQRKIDEVNPACYIMKTSFLNKYLQKIKKSSITGEYYLTSLIDIAIKNNEKLSTLNAGNIPWRGVNTGEELEAAKKLYNELNSNFAS